MQKWKPWKDPPFYKKPPSFESGKEMMEWYRKAYRIPRIQRKIKGIGKNFIEDLRIKLGGTYKGTNIPSHIMKKGVGSPELRNHLLDQLDDSFNEVEKAAKKRVSKEQRAIEKRISKTFKSDLKALDKGFSQRLEQGRIASLKRAETELKRIEKYSKVNKQPWLLRGALGKAAGILSLLIPTEIDPEGTSELPYPQTPFPQEDALIKQQQRQGMYGGGIVQSTTSKRKVKRKTKKRNWNY